MLAGMVVSWKEKWDSWGRERERKEWEKVRRRLDIEAKRARGRDKTRMGRLWGEHGARLGKLEAGQVAHEAEPGEHKAGLGKHGGGEEQGAGRQQQRADGALLPLRPGTHSQGHMASVSRPWTGAATQGWRWRK